MACVRVTDPVQHHLITSAATDSIQYFTEWMPAIGMEDALATLKLANVSGGFRATVVVQTAAVRADKPDAPTLIGSIANQTSDDEFFFSAATVGIGTLVEGKAWVRFGVAYDVSSTPAVGQADVTLQLAIRQCGSMLAPWTGTLSTVTSEDGFVAITGWLPALAVVDFQATIVLSSKVGAIRLKLTYRTAETSPEAADTWDPTGLGNDLSADGETTQGALAPTTTGKMWIQLGIRFDLTSGTYAQADVAALIGIRSAA